MIEYKKIPIEDKNQLKTLIDTVYNSLERKEFFMPFTEEEIDDIFDENKVINMGAYDEEKLVGTAQLYLEETCVKKIKQEIKLQSNKVIELGGYLVLEKYRNQGIMKMLETILIEKAKKLDYEFIVITVHPENIFSNKATEFTGARLVKTAHLGEYLRNVYVLDLKK